MESVVTLVIEQDVFVIFIHFHLYVYQFSVLCLTILLFKEFISILMLIFVGPMLLKFCFWPV